jgi:rfaE bifunctional protein nucleotidyltransferase chain/domain
MKLAHNENMAPLIGSHEELARQVKAMKELGQKIVLTQGVWDMVHTGHVRYLEKAKAEGDVLIVGVDSDRMTRLRKGPKRPFDPEEERLCIIRSFRCVDFVILRDNGGDKMDTLKAVKPDVFVISETTGPEIQKEIKKFEKFAAAVVNLEQQSSTTTTAKLRRLQGETIDDFGNELEEVLRRFKAKINGEEVV